MWKTDAGLEHYYFSSNNSLDPVKSRQCHNVCCSCLMFLKPTSNVFELLTLWAKNLEVDPRPDQDALNQLIPRMLPRLKVELLNPADFPNGQLYWSQYYRNKEGPSIVHNNYIVGHDPKKARFVSSGLWFIKK